MFFREDRTGFGRRGREEHRRQLCGFFHRHEAVPHGPPAAGPLLRSGGCARLAARDEMVEMQPDVGSLRWRVSERDGAVEGGAGLVRAAELVEVAPFTPKKDGSMWDLLPSHSKDEADSDMALFPFPPHGVSARNTKRWPACWVSAPASPAPGAASNAKPLPLRIWCSRGWSPAPR